MNWWKASQIENFDERNDANRRIKKLTALAELLKYCAKLIYQTARGARSLAYEIAHNKTLSSFPDALELLEEADNFALDSPQKFSVLCHQAAEMLEAAVAHLEQERSDFSDRISHPKGIVDDE
jgi:hypothetical protein